MKVFKLVLMLTVLMVGLSLSMPRKASATGNVCTPCTATWTANASTDNVTGYNVYLSTNAAATIANSTKAAAGNVTTATMATLFTLTNGTQYYTFVTAVNVAGESGASTIVPFVYQNAAPGVVQGVTVK
jgi:hypothetical protein